MPGKEIIYENTNVISVDKRVNIIHFNDVYNIESSTAEPAAGAARFITAIESLVDKIDASDPNTSTIVLFSGDAISPSSLSMLVKGKQMVEILNKCHIACACLGNHDFDFGLDVLLTHISNSNFPWLLSNVFDPETKLPLGNVKDTHVIETIGLKIGIIGLVEEEWITTLSTINYDDIIYEPFVDTAKKLYNQLKNEQKCDIVIALTHMRWHNDIELAESVPEIDIILGGHDHDFIVKKINDKWIVKSGTDFREFSLIELNYSQSNKMTSIDKIEKYIVDSQIAEKPEIKAIVDNYMNSINAELEQYLGYINVELEGRFSYIRSQETNLGNFITDIMLAAVNADCAILNSGSLRSDVVHPIGEFKVKDLKKILPYLDESVVLNVTGSQLLEALENGVSQYPKHEGRFLQVSGLEFAFDPALPGGKRIDPRLVKVQDEYLNFSKDYSLITKAYLKQGKDGFDCLINCPVLIDEENIPMLYNLVENHFKTIAKLKKDRTIQKFRSSIVPLFLVNRLINKLSEDPNILKEEDNDESHGQQQQQQQQQQKMNFSDAAMIISRVLSHKNKALSKIQRNKIKQSDSYKQKMREFEEHAMQLAPKCENRIVVIRDQQHYRNLLKLRDEELSKKIIQKPVVNQ